jgi:hypothetical protein
MGLFSFWGTICRAPLRIAFDLILGEKDKARRIIALHDD